jgi:threonine aldolase
MIDLRSDTVTKPSKEMLKAMYDAELGDDVYKEDPTANELERYAAELLGKEAALFVPSGVMGNQICLNVLTHPMDEVICEKDAHIFQYESGSPTALSGIQLLQVEGKRGVFTPEQIEPLIRPTSAYYMPRSRVIEVENTHNRAGGTINPIENIAALSQLVKKYNLFFHLDGARIWNASVATGISPSKYASYFDSVSCCLSKGLGAPIGSVIAGTKDFIKEAFRIRKAWGGGMRQVGVIAAAGLFALKNNIDRLQEDHQKAKNLAEFLNASDKYEIELESVQTNIIVFKPKNNTVEDILEKAKGKGLILSVGNVGWIRAVTHMDVTFDQIEKAKEILEQI